MAALNRRVERAGLLSNLGPCCKALCARRDFAIRRQLLKNDKVDSHFEIALRIFSDFSACSLKLRDLPPLFVQGLTKQYPITPVVDNELLQMSMRLFRRTMAGQASGPERPDTGSAPAAEAAAPSGGGNKLSTAQPEVRVS